MNYPDDDLEPSARDILEERKNQLIRQALMLRERKKALMAEVRSMEEKLDAVATKIGALQEVLNSDLDQTAPRRPSSDSFDKIPVSEAADVLLQEAGGYLSSSQIRRGLRAHRADPGSTTNIRIELNGAVQQGAPLMQVASDLWGRRDWADQARVARTDLHKQ